MPTAQSILTHSPDLAVIEAVTTPVESEVVVVGIAADAGSGEGGGTKAAPVVVAPGLDGDSTAALADLAHSVGASTKVGSTTRVPAPAGVPGRSVVLVGLGSSDDEVGDETLRRAAGAAARACRGLGAALVLLDPGRAEAVALGAALGSFRPAKVTAKDDGDDEKADSVKVLVAEGGEDAVTRAATIAECVSLARDLVNTPPNLLFPGSFADRAADLAAGAGLEVEVLDESALAEGGFGGILAVGGGSSRGPRLVRLTHRGAEGRPTVALVGKGVTFDTGGISIKPAAGMEQMTMDMGGAAAVVATVILAARLGLDLTVVATVPMAENMPSSTAYRPGDVLTMYGGTTVEVQNTDAEGRLILADAIVRACEDSPSHLIDTATLTGAQMVALGKKTPGVMGTEDFRDRVAGLSREVGEGGWPMPLPEELRDGLDSEVADLTNVTPHRWGGMLSAGLFLSEFVAEGVEWVHIDVAGPAYNDGGAEGYLPKGGTGVPVRTMLAALEDIASAG
ncbi:leucyl aminopeptidase [Dietzia natronolimnaea]|uniref:Probable cytosol aminopeptidase n=1 Tax=Dietzia natronolimnaea TaxID=161920 RepID=A0A2A2WTM4_9ACTN|nr:leucyl aminopeptidase [Dietzia natronolimnaea]PAY24383.1 leucyl aminopeptidase [Dietzia natronolimnaea]